jgi:pyrroloquinoline-quinone synthase
VPAVAREKIRGLSEFYGMDGEQVAFFSVHETLDLEHAEAERESIGALATSESSRSAAVEATDEATEALWRFLDGVYED